MHLLQALSRNRWSKVLTDQRLMAPYTPAELAWLSEEWLPRAVHEHGYHHGAFIVSHDVFTRLAMNQLVLANRALPLTYRTFETEAAAVA